MSYPSGNYQGSMINGFFDEFAKLGEFHPIDQTSIQVKEALHEIQLSHNYAVCYVTFALNCMSNLVQKKVGAAPVDLDCLIKVYMEQIIKILNQFAQELTAILKVEPSSADISKAIQHLTDKENS